MEASVQGTARHVRLSRSCHRLLRCRWATRAAPDGGIYAGSTYSVSLVRADVASRHELEISVRDSDARCTVGAWGGGMDSAGGHLRVHRCAGRCAAAVRPQDRYGINRAAACAAYLCPPLCRLPLVSPPVAHRSWPAIHRHSPPLAAARCRSPHTHLRRPSRTLRARHGSPTAASRLCRAACTTPVSSRRSRCRAIHIRPARPPLTPPSPAAALPLAAVVAPPCRLLPPRLPPRLRCCHRQGRCRRHTRDT